MDILNTNLFYRSLIKAPLALSVRNDLGKLTASVKRQSYAAQWSNIKKQEKSLLKYLQSLYHNGYLPLSFTFNSRLAYELNTLDRTGKGQAGPGGRSETEALSGVDKLPSVKLLVQDKFLFSLVSLYLGAPAHLHTCQAWWQYPMGQDHNPSNAQLWHRDRDDLSELKLFFYATDVDNESGPHAFIPKSHRPDLFSELFPESSLSNTIINGSDNQFFDDSFLSSVGFYGVIKKWIGPAGTCFLEDTRGFHRAYLPISKPRLIFSLVWTVGTGF